MPPSHGGGWRTDWRAGEWCRHPERGWGWPRVESAAPDSGVYWDAVSGDGFGGPSVNERAAGSTDWDWSRWAPSVPDAAERTTGNTVWDGSGWVTSVADVAERTTGNTDWSGSGGAASVADVAPPDDNFHGGNWFGSWPLPTCDSQGHQPAPAAADAGAGVLLLKTAFTIRKTPARTVRRDNGNAKAWIHNILRRAWQYLEAA